MVNNALKNNNNKERKKGRKEGRNSVSQSVLVKTD